MSATNEGLPVHHGDGGEAVVIAEALRLLGEGKSQRQVAAQIGKSRIWVRSLPKPGFAPAVTEIEPRTVPEYVERIVACCRRTLEAIVEAGTLLIRAKENLPHGEFEGMIERDLPFGSRHARRLMAVAADARIANRTHVSVLPEAVGTLYELTKLDDVTFERRVADGTIRPDMGRQDLALRVKQERRVVHAGRALTGGTVENLHQLVASGFRAATILADPAWKFVTRSERGEGRSANQHYRTEGLELIKQLPVDQLAADDAVLFMWMVDWCPAAAFEVMEAWGFTHKTTAFTWAKQNQSGEGWHMGQGYWTRANPEDCWLGVRGKPKRLHEDVRQLIVAPVMEHSRKPDEIYDRIERLVEGPYLELYARRERPGWVSWGDELPFTVPLPAHDLETGEVIEHVTAAATRGALLDVSITPVLVRKSSPEYPAPPHDPETGDILEASSASGECAA
jgi:N6-adenosine-specific RNA methylase IME4